jgi:hypothetical protein
MLSLYVEDFGNLSGTKWNFVIQSNLLKDNSFCVCLSGSGLRLSSPFYTWGVKVWKASVTDDGQENQVNPSYPPF